MTGTPESNDVSDLLLIEAQIIVLQGTNSITRYVLFQRLQNQDCSRDKYSFLLFNFQ